LPSKQASLGDHVIDQIPDGMLEPGVAEEDSKRPIVILIFQQPW
jgi:hypothetical protein